MYYAKFIAAFKNSAGEWTAFLNDNGDGSPPVEYLMLVEDGLRASSEDIYVMGTKPLRSPEHWGKNVDTWRKIESYIALARFLLGCSQEYKQWDCFRFEDYVQRMSLTKTFDTRHYPLSDGQDDKNFGEGSMFFDWDMYAETSKSRTRVKAEPSDEYQSVTVTKVDAAKGAQPLMIFDVTRI